MAKYGQLLVVILGTLLACKPQSKVEEHQSGSPLYSVTKIEKKSGCISEDDTSKCIHIDLSYPTMSDGSSTFKPYYNHLIDSLMASTIRSFKIEADSTAGSTNKLEDEINSLFENFETVSAESGAEQANRWEVECEATIGFENNQLLCINIVTYSYTGGAHPNTYTQLVTVDKIAHKIIPVAALFADQTKVTQWLETEFKLAKNLEAQADLEQKGYFLKDGKFFLPDNVSFCKDSIVFYYNDYEIASHAEGPIELKFPLSQVKTYLEGSLVEKLR
jgi:hypothetical protein